MANYEEPILVTYTRTVAGASTSTWSVAPPPGCDKVRVESITASVTTAFVGSTTPGQLSVGVAGNVAAAGYINFGTIAVPSPINSTVTLKDQFVKGVNPLYGTLDLTGLNNTITITAGKKIPQVLGPVLITNTAGVGTPAGAGIAEITLAWF